MHPVFAKIFWCRGAPENLNLFSPVLSCSGAGTGAGAPTTPAPRDPRACGIHLHNWDAPGVYCLAALEQLIVALTFHGIFWQDKGQETCLENRSLRVRSLRVKGEAFSSRGCERKFMGSLAKMLELLPSSPRTRGEGVGFCLLPPKAWGGLRGVMF